MASNRKDQPQTTPSPPVPAPTPKTAQESARERALESAYHQRWQREAAHQKEQVRRRAIRRGEATELGDRWKNSDRSEVSFQAMTEQLHEGSHIYDVELKNALLRKVDRFSVRSAYRQMDGLFPDEYAAFVLAYPLDDEAKAPGDPDDNETLYARLDSMRKRTALAHKEIAAKLHLSRQAVGQRLKRGRYYFKVLYLGQVHPADAATLLEQARRLTADEADEAC